MNAPLVELDGLTVGYRRRGKRRDVLGPLSLSLAPGELVAVVGPNGIGKSTLLRTIAGLQRPLAGAVRISGEPLASIPPLRRARLIGVVLSERIAVGALRARQMVALGRYAHGGWSGHMTARDHEVVEQSLAAVGATQLADRDCREVSDGEMQKLNIARALAQEPAIVVLDEPTAFLDVSARAGLTAVLHGLTRKSAISVIASTHDLDVAFRRSDGVWLIDPDGRIHTGSPEDLIANGLVDAAFANGGSSFDPAAMRFRDLPSDNSLTAIVTGPPVAVALAEAVLERAGFQRGGDARPPMLAIEFAADGRRWRTLHTGPEVAGTNFAALAAFARRFADATPTNNSSLLQSKG